MAAYEYLIRCMTCGYVIPHTDAMAQLEMMVHLEAQHSICTGPREAV